MCYVKDGCMIALLGQETLGALCVDEEMMF